MTKVSKETKESKEIICGYSKKTNRCNRSSKENPKLCELSAKNYCRIKKAKSYDYSKFMIGQSSGKSLHGISLSLLKSALQKYIRRSETEKAIKCLLEFDTVFILETADDNVVAEFNRQSTQKAAPFSKSSINQFGIKNRTNIANRLLVISSEEVNINDNPNLPVVILDLYMKWRENRDKLLSVNYLIKIVILLSNAKKCRLPSYLKSAFTLPPYYIKDEVEYFKFYQGVILKKYAGFDKRTESSIGYTFDVLKQLLGGVHEVKGAVKGTVRGEISEKVFRCFGEIVKEDSGIFNKVWAYILALVDNDSVRALHQIYKMMGHQEKPIYLYHAILLVVYYDELEWGKEVTMPNIGEIKGDINISDWTEIDDYVIDQHVKGDKTLASHIRLLKESFYIEPKHFMKRFLREDYVAIYRDIKIGVGFYEENGLFPTLEQVHFYVEYYFEDKNSSGREIELVSKMRDLDALVKVAGIPIKVISVEESDAFNKFLGGLPLAQQRTGRSKKFTYIDFDNKTIIKGPYMYNEFPMITALKYNYALEVLDKNTRSQTGWKWDELLLDGENYYMVTGFVSENYEKNEAVRKSKLVFKAKESWKGGKTYYYFERDSKVLGYRIKDMIDDNMFLKEGSKTTKIIIDVLQHLYLRYVLGVGDTHTSNLLFVDIAKKKQVVAGIDMEELRKIFNDENIITLLFTRNIKKVEIIFRPYVHSIRLIKWDTPKVKSVFKLLFLGEQIKAMKERDALLRDMLVKDLAVSS